MLYSYKGLNEDGYVVKGTIESMDLKKAIRELKESKEIAVLLDVQKSINSPSINKLRAKYQKRTELIENKRKEKEWAKELKKIQAAKKRLEEERKENKESRTSEQKPFSLKSLSSTKLKMPSLSKFLPEKKEPKLNLDDESMAKLENLFAEKVKEIASLEEVDFDEKIEQYEKALQIEERVKNRLSEKVGDREIDWNLIKESTDNSKISKNYKVKVKPAEVFLFTRRLHIMLSSGVALLNGLIMLRDSSSAGMQKILDEIIQTIQSGSSFSEALSRFPKHFNHIYVALVSVGENSGSMVRCLKDILMIQEQQMSVKKKMKSALVYPATIGVVLVALLIFGSVYFIPNFQSLFAEQGMELPFLTKIVFTAAGWMPYILGSLAAIVMILLYLKKRVPSVDQFIKKHLHKLYLTLPVVKKVTNANYMFTFASTIALMLGNGIRLKDTLSLTYRTISNIYIKNGIMGASALMVRGNSFSEALKQQPYFDSILVNIVETGEESGRMTFSLEQIATYFKEDLDKQISVLLELVQPVSIFLVAMLIGPVIIAVYLPILDMSSGALGNI